MLCYTMEKVRLTVSMTYDSLEVAPFTGQHFLEIQATNTRGRLPENQSAGAGVRNDC